MKPIKLILIINLLGLFLIGCAGTLPIVPYEEQQVSHMFVTRLSEEETFDKILEYLSIAFVNIDNILRLKDRERKVLVCKASVNYRACIVEPCMSNEQRDILCSFSFVVEIKEGRYRTKLKYPSFINNVNQLEIPATISVVEKAHRDFRIFTLRLEEYVNRFDEW